MSTNRKAVIIGAGVAGLASAIRLAVQGFDVVVYEKN
ncbi:MAG: FAD-dependent oxidoreductase, partial [Segetibacter sp.]